ncbi:MAG: hypothetical protein ACLFOY_13995 [Desulfatibacillaceae bacterium]
MVQVDIFWSYALGASFAAAAARQIKDEKKTFENKYFTYTLFFLACLFAPSGIYLLWNFPHWETMQVASTHGDLPAWLVTLFAVTNITQGILGFWVTHRFIRQGRFYAAHMQWFLGYFAMFFILLHGWDGLGWQRFLYDPTVDNGAPWQPGMHMGARFFASNVALTLAGMGVFIIPALVIPMAKWIREGAMADPDVEDREVPGAVALYIRIGIGVFGVGFGSAAVAAGIVQGVGMATGSLLAGFLVGLPAFGLACHLFVFRRGGPVYSVFSRLFLKEQPQAA